MGEDLITLDHLFFTALAAGPLTAAEFRIGGKAINEDQHIIYNQNTGALFYDRDGSDTAKPVQFATLDAKLALSAADFLVV